MFLMATVSVDVLEIGQIAAYLEQEMGFKNVTRLEGGIVSYSKFVKTNQKESKFKVRW